MSLWLLAAWLPAAAIACTYFEVEAPHGVWVAGRTMELGGGGGGLLEEAGQARIPWRAVLHPRSSTQRFGFVGIETKELGITVVADGMNEAGLSVGLQTMRMSKYQEREEGKRSVIAYKVVDLLLGGADSVEAAQELLANVSIISGGLGEETFGHWSVADASGKSVVVEYVDGALRVHQNDVRVMTNDPDYEWHLKNLNMYVGLSPGAPVLNEHLAVQTEVGPVPKVWSQGMNLQGLPGDKSPAGRFVRMFYLRKYAETNVPVRSTDEAIVLATGLLNDAFIPKGAAAPLRQAWSTREYDFTQFGLLKIPAQGRLLFRTYRNMVWKEINLRSLKWDAPAKISLDDGSLGIEDVTSKFQGSGLFAV